MSSYVDDDDYDEIGIFLHCLHIFSCVLLHTVGLVTWVGKLMGWVELCYRKWTHDHVCFRLEA